MVRRWQDVACALLLPAAVAVVFWPVLGMALIGDDYQWVQHARQALRRPLLLLADLDTFYRPASTMTLAADELIWNGRPVGFRITNLALHAVCGVLLLRAGRRLGLSLLAAGAVALLWVASPFALEPASQVAIRFEHLLLAAWLGMIAAWPREVWTPGRAAVIAGLTAAALLSKETWVVTPALVWVLEVVVRRCPTRVAARTAFPFALAAGAYVVAYFLAFPGDKGYFQLEFETLAKVPHQMAAFLHLEDPVPLQFPLSWRTAIAAAAVAGLGTLAVRWRAPAGVVGLGLLLVPSLPTLFVPYLPGRYNSVPYLGFLLLVAGVTSVRPGRRGGQRWRQAAVAATAAAVALVLAADVATVRADLEDYGRVAAAHERLLAEARAAARGFPVGMPVVHVRDESENPLREIAASPRGVLKLFYPRHQDPYGLVDAAALFDFVLADRGVSVRVLRDDEPSLAAAGVLLVHRTGGFEWVAASQPAAELLRAARGRGLYARPLLAKAH